MTLILLAAIIAFGLATSASASAWTTHQHFKCWDMTRKFLQVGLVLLFLVGISTTHTHAQMYEDSSGSWLNESGGNLFGDSMINPMADPMINPMADPMINPDADPLINPYADPMISPMGDPRYDPETGMKRHGYQEVLVI